MRLLTIYIVFFQPVNEMMMKLSFFQQALVSSSRVFHLMDEKDLAPVQKGDGNPQVINGDIEFKNVTFFVRWKT